MRVVKTVIKRCLHIHVCIFHLHVMVQNCVVPCRINELCTLVVWNFTIWFLSVQCQHWNGWEAGSIVFSGCLIIPFFKTAWRKFFLHLDPKIVRFWWWFSHKSIMIFLCLRCCRVKCARRKSYLKHSSPPSCWTSRDCGCTMLPSLYQSLTVLWG